MKAAAQGRRGVTGRSWPGVVSRVVAAVLGGYGLAILVAAAISLALPAARSEAVLAGMMVSFLVYLAAAIWVFAARTALRAWIGLALPAALLGVLLIVVQAVAAP